MICLDTNAVIAAMNPSKTRVRAKLEHALAGRDTVGISTVALQELWYGVRKSARPQVNAAALTKFLSVRIVLWPFEAGDAEDAGDIRAVLRRAGTPIGPYDILIAAQARRRNAILITANTREFARVPGLRTEDWGQAE